MNFRSHLAAFVVLCFLWLLFFSGFQIPIVLYSSTIPFLETLSTNTPQPFRNGSPCTDAGNWISQKMRSPLPALLLAHCSVFLSFFCLSDITDQQQTIYSPDPVPDERQPRLSSSLDTICPSSSKPAQLGNTATQRKGRAFNYSWVTRWARELWSGEFHYSPDTLYICRMAVRSP